VLTILHTAKLVLTILHTAKLVLTILHMTEYFTKEVANLYLSI